MSDDGKLICIDPLTNNYLNVDLQENDILNNKTIYNYFHNQYERFIDNTKNLDSNKIELYRNNSFDIFPELIKKYLEQFDLIYIDGDHRSKFVYIDAINSFRLCKKNGLILFDDYLWNVQGDGPKLGIDKFLNEYFGKYDLLIKSNQLLIRKNN